MQEEGAGTTMIATRKVMVMRLPEEPGGKQGRSFLRELQARMDADRPRVVLDCSSVLHLDKGAIQILFRCLEEAMKRNGDARLAVVPSGSETALEISGASRIFEIFDTTEEAVASFRQLPAGARSAADMLATSPSLGSESVA